jgi:PTS system fructose-specific IIC component
LLLPNLEAKTADEAIDRLCQAMLAAGVISDLEGFKEAVEKREKIYSTAVEKGVAFPHARGHHAARLAFAVATIAKGVAMKAPDRRRTRIVFLIAVPDFSAGVYMQLLSLLAGFVHREEWREKLLEATTPKQILRLLQSVK